MPDTLKDLVANLGHGRPTHEIVADALRRRIALGGYEPGELLPTERELAATLGIGRAALRTALRQLAAEGLVSTKPGRSGGTRVLAAGRSLGVENGGLDAERARALADVLDVRAVLEPLSARRAAERAAPDAAEALLRIVVAEVDSVEAYTMIDTRFHIAVARVSGNELLIELVERAREGFFAWANDLWFHMDLRARDDVRDQLNASVAEHRPIADAIAHGDGDAAERLMRAHVRAGAESYGEIFARAGRRR